MPIWKASLVIFFIILFVGVVADLSTSPQVYNQPSTSNNQENSPVSASTSESVIADDNVIEPVVSKSDTITEKKEVNQYIVERVIDGDTIVLKNTSGTITVRLIGINSPESVDPRKTVECFGKESSTYLAKLVLGKTIEMRSDPTQQQRDKYDRWLGYIFLSDDQFINKKMIEEGYAYEYTYQIPYEYQQEFKEAQVHAERNKLGLWADNACVATTSPSTAVEQKPQSATYQCSLNFYDCSDFNLRKDAKAVFDACGGVSNDIHKLDADKDGIPCETLP